MTLLILLQSEAALFPTLNINPATGEISVVAWVPFGVEIEQSVTTFQEDQVGGWLPDARAYKTAKRREKIKAKRERRQDYVMRKVWNELKGLEPDERLLALMAEFETIEDVFKSSAELQAELNKAYYDYIIIKRKREAAQDQEDEAAIMAALSELL